MSSILEALKKLEEEKAARRRGLGNIAGKVTSAGRRARQKPAWTVPVAMAAIAVFAVLGTYAVMGGFSSRHGGTAQLASTTPPLPVPTPPLQAAAPVEAPSAPRPVLPAPAPRIAVQSPAATPHASTASPAATKPPVPLLPQTESPSENAGAPSPPVSAGQFPTINVSGIAWQKDNAARLAVVNGAPVAEGASVAGARVDEIFPDRVRFTYRDRSFEIFLNK